MTAPAIETKALTRRFRDVVAVDGLDLTVHGPGVFGFLGANGAGKTTTLRMLVGLLHPTSGVALLHGERLDEGRPATRRRLGYLPQDPAFHPWMTGHEALVHTAGLFGIPRKESANRASELLERSGLTDAAKRRVGGYSGGMKQRLGIAQALINRPDIVLLDEPVSALDPVGRADVLDFIAHLGEQATVFMSSHILADVERVCSEVAILHRGRLLVHESTKALKARLVKPALTVAVRGDASALINGLKAHEAFASIESIARDADDPPDVSRLRINVANAQEGERALPKLIAAAGLGLVALTPSAPSLEDVFMLLIKNSQRGADA